MSDVAGEDVTAQARARLHQLAAEYELICEIGRGAAAVVYRARDRELGRDVALKVVHQTHVEDADAVGRLAREARLIARLRHPGIVTLYGTRQLDDGSTALIMQYVPGRTLKAIIREQGPLPIRTVLRILSDIASALEYAHRKQVIHRDVKPENICIDEDGERALLSDFGIARSALGDTSLTIVGTALGTPAYMSPEQVDGSTLDGRSDLYSLGLVAYEMLTGRQPWAGENLYTTIYKQKHEDLPPIENFRGDITPELQRALSGLLHKDREARWRDAAEFLAELTFAEARGSAPIVHRVAQPPRAVPTIPDAVVQEDTPTVLYLAAVEPPPGDGTPAAQAELTSISRVEYEPVIRSSAPAPALRFFLEPEIAGASPALARAPAAAVAKKFRWRRAAVLIPLGLFAVGAAAAPIMVGDSDIRSTIGRAFPGAAASQAEPVFRRLVPLTQGQIGVTGGVLPLPVGIVVRDDSGRAVAGIDVEFDVIAGGGRVQSRTTSTDAQGLATVRWTLGPRPGLNQLQARLPGRPDEMAIINASALVGPAARLTRMSRDDALWAGRDSMRLVLRAEDEFGNAVPGAPVELSVRSGGGSVRPRTTVADSAGLVVAMWKRGNAGVDSLRATLPQAQYSIDLAAYGAFRLAIEPAVAAGGGHTCILDVRVGSPGTELEFAL